jgi:hypothetical protein
MAAEFEALKGIPYVIGAIGGNHIPIIAPPIDPTSYYCRKGYYSVLLQGVVDFDTMTLGGLAVVTIGHYFKIQTLVKG